MLTRLHVKGFKNLVDVQVYFGPFTCIAGVNGVGKSNLFDALHFLSLLADKPFIEAASNVRGGEEDIRHLFTQGGDSLIHLECDVLIPHEGRDDFNTPAISSAWYVTYSIQLRMGSTDDKGAPPQIHLVSETLTRILKGHAKERLPFQASDEWRSAVVGDHKRTADYITTRENLTGSEKIIKLHADSSGHHGSKGRPREFPSSNVPRSVLSSAQHAGEYPTAVILRQEMRNWQQVQLEPSCLGRPDKTYDPPRVTMHGEHVPATISRLNMDASGDREIYTEVANRLAELVDGIGEIKVVRDQGRNTLQLLVSDLSGIELPASSLSDGTLRFLALSVMEADPDVTGLLCLEEPENGIHPDRIPAMLRLLTDMAVDPDYPPDNDNPLRQVIISTHSPVLVSNAAENAVVFATKSRHKVSKNALTGLTISGLSDSWRSEQDKKSISRYDVMAYLGASFYLQGPGVEGQSPPSSRTVAQGLSKQMALSFQESHIF